MKMDLWPFYFLRSFFTDCAFGTHLGQFYVVLEMVMPWLPLKTFGWRVCERTAEIERRFISRT